MRTIIAITLLCTLLTGGLHAQNRISDNNTIGWLSTVITPGITKKLSGHIEYQWRRDNLVTDWQQSLLRVGLNYKIHPQVIAHAGYGWILTYPYGEPNIIAISKTFPEHRIYEQLVINSVIGKVTLQQRIRLEQRWVGKMDTTASEKPSSYTYLNRARYMLRAEVPVYKRLYVAAFDELFIGFGKNVGENIFDQNRISALVGYKFSDAIKIEAGYLSQTVQLSREVGNKNVYQYNTGVLVNAFVQLNRK